MTQLLHGIWNPATGSMPASDLNGVVTRVHSMDGHTPRPTAHRRVAPPRRIAQTDFVEALGHGISLLECWQETDLWLANADLAARCGLTKSTVSRLSSVLVDLGYLSREAGRGRLRLTSATFELGFGHAFASEPIAEVRPELARLAKELDVYVALGIRRLDKVQILDNVVSPMHPDVVTMDIGEMLPICRSASGYAALSALSEQHAVLLMEQLRTRYGERWQTLQKQVRRTQQEFSDKGYCSSIAHLSRDVAAVAIPVVPKGGNDIYVIGCGMPATEFHRARVENEIVPQMRRVAQELARAMGG